MGDLADKRRETYMKDDSNNEVNWRKAIMNKKRDL